MIDNNYIDESTLAAGKYTGSQTASGARKTAALSLQPELPRTLIGAGK
jgi:hypothetical protein